jgi:hypothetical protein
MWIRYLNRKRQTSHGLHGETHVTDEREEKPHEIKNDFSIYINISCI